MQQSKIGGNFNVVCKCSVQQHCVSDATTWYLVVVLCFWGVTVINKSQGNMNLLLSTGVISFLVLIVAWVLATSPLRNPQHKQHG